VYIPNCLLQAAARFDCDSRCSCQYDICPPPWISKINIFLRPTWSVIERWCR